MRNVVESYERFIYQITVHVMHIYPFFIICTNLDCFICMPWFHRFNKAYETIEYGDILDALTDLTGAICEYFTPDVNPPEQFFYTLYTSVVNRSLVVCWRNEKRLTWSGFNFEGVCNQKAQIPCDMYYMDKWSSFVGMKYLIIVPFFHVSLI